MELEYCTVNLLGKEFTLFTFTLEYNLKPVQLWYVASMYTQPHVTYMHIHLLPNIQHIYIHLCWIISIRIHLFKIYTINRD